jgi:hypothetical protein
MPLMSQHSGALQHSTIITASFFLAGIWMTYLLGVT